MNRVVRTVLGVSVLILLGVGLVTLMSAGGANGVYLYGEGHEMFFFMKQVKWLVFSLIAFGIVYCVDYHHWRDHSWLTWLGFSLVLVLLASVFLFDPVKGSRRWLMLGSLRLQPSEFAKVATVLATSVYLDHIGCRIERFFKGVVPAAAIVGLPLLLAANEPDYGSAMVLGLIGALLFLLAGMKWRHIMPIGLLALAGGVWSVLHTPNRVKRLAGQLPEWLSQALGIDPSLIAEASNANSGGGSYQLDMSIQAILNGGLTGTPGLFNSKQKGGFLPEMHTDFIFAIGAEEWGLIFSLLVLFLFVAFFVCGIIIAKRAPDRFGRMLAYGLTCLIFFQAMFNILVVTGWAPTKGMALPFISYGGTSMFATMVAVGMIFNIGRHMEAPRRRPRCTFQSNFVPR